MFYRNADDILGSLISSNASLKLQTDVNVVWWRKHTYVTSFYFFFLHYFTINNKCLSSYYSNQSSDNDLPA